MTDPGPIPDALEGADLDAIRQALMREVETVNVYDKLETGAPTPAVKHLIAHLRDEEQEHIIECYEWLKRYDPVLAAVAATKDPAHFLHGGPEHVEGGAPDMGDAAATAAATTDDVEDSPRAAPAVAEVVGLTMPAAASTPPAPLTIGSLRQTSASGMGESLMSSGEGEDDADDAGIRAPRAATAPASPPALLSQPGLTVGTLRT